MLILYNYLFILSFTPIFSELLLRHYCKYDKNNVPCKTRCQWARACGNSRNYTRWSVDDKVQILNTINSYRSSMALKQINGLSPININIISYDTEAEFLAACHLKRCTYTFARVRLSLEGKTYGYTFATYSLEETISSAFGRNWLVLAALKSLSDWATEKSYKNISNEEILRVYKKHTGLDNWSQLYWGKTRRVGCAAVTNMNGDIFVVTIYCYYYPAGNIVGQPVVELGNETTCPDLVMVNTTDNQTVAMCGVQRIHDSYYRPVDYSISYSLHRPTAVLIFSFLMLSAVIKRTHL